MKGARFACGVPALAALLAVAGCGPDSLQIKMDADKAWDSAEKVLQAAAEDSDAQTRWLAIEAVASVQSRRGGAVFMKGLADPHAAVRAAAANAIGDVGYAPAKGLLKAMIEDKESRFWEKDRRVLGPVIYALWQLGDDSHVKDLAKLLWDKRAAVRANAAQAMGKMKHEAAIRHLKTLHRDEEDPMVQIQLVESLSLLGDRASQRFLEAYTKSAFIDEQVVAIQALGRVKSPRGESLLKGLLGSKNLPRVRVAAAGSLGGLGHFDRGGYDLCLDAVRDPERVMKKSSTMKGQRIKQDHATALRQLAAISVGWMGKDGAVDSLYALLDNPQGSVRVAAAMSILRLLSDEQGRLRVAPARRRWSW